jgi:hypothetical protein
VFTDRTSLYTYTSLSTVSYTSAIITPIDLLITTSTVDSWSRYLKFITVSSPTSQTYTLTGSTTTYTFPDFTFLLICSDMVFTYTATLSDGSSLPSFLSLSSNTRVFTLTSTSNLAYVGSYTIKVTGTTPSPDL